MLKILPSAIKSAAVATGDRGRFALEYVRITPTGMVEATNGRLLVRVGPCGDAVEDGTPTLSAAVLLNPVTVDAIVKAEAKAKRKPLGTLMVDVEATNANGKVHVSGLASGLSVSPDKPAVAFPLTDDVIPPSAKPGNGMAVFFLGVEVLADLAAAAAAAGCSSLRFQVNTVVPESATDFEKRSGVRGAVRLDGRGAYGASDLPFVAAVAALSPSSD